MKTHRVVDKNVVTVHYALTERELEILRFIKENEVLQFRQGKTEDYTGSVYMHEVEDLEKYGFISPDMYAWHYEYYLTDLGDIVTS